MADDGESPAVPDGEGSRKPLRARKGLTVRFGFEDPTTVPPAPLSVPPPANPQVPANLPPVDSNAPTKLIQPRKEPPISHLPPKILDPQATVLETGARLGPRGRENMQPAAPDPAPAGEPDEDTDDRDTSDLRKILSRSQGALAPGSGSLPSAKSSGRRKALEQTGVKAGAASGVQSTADHLGAKPAAGSPPVTQMMRLNGDSFGSYLLNKRMTAGGFGEVWSAVEEATGRKVVLKRLKPEQAENKRAFYQFDIEIEIGTRIKHPNLVPVLKHGVEEGRRFFTMPQIEGPSLTRILERKAGPEWALSKPEILRAIEFICRALGFLHRARVIHCDIKPDNILFESKVRPKLIDLGIARTVDWEQTGYRALKGFREDKSILGTPEYMAPELFEGDWRNIGYPADLYSVGVILYEILGGQPPFRRDTEMAKHDHTTAILNLAKQVQQVPARPILELEPATPPALADLAMQCLEKDPLKRPANADAVAIALSQGLQSMGNTGRMTQLERMTKMFRNPGSRPPGAGGTI